jgi:hypothetical protein
MRRARHQPSERKPLSPKPYWLIHPVHYTERFPRARLKQVETNKGLLEGLTTFQLGAVGDEQAALHWLLHSTAKPCPTLSWRL